MRNEKEVWKFINKRRKRNWIRNKISKEVWKKHFMALLDEEETVEGGRSRNTQEDEGCKRNGDLRRIEDDEELEEEEIRQAVLRMKLKKAAGFDGIPME